jgi:DNA (cytosine-5)-methyltransferase 1
MNYLSVCSGIEAATVAWHNIGWNPIGFSEIEKFPSQLLQHHYPHVTNYGDMTKYKEWKLNDTIGLLVGGTPCQSFSVAGLRKGLEDPRGNLMLTYLGIADCFKPKWILWENVPGVLSSNGGKDFASLLQGLAELGYGFAYRVLDAQHFGVPQRRKRVFVVGCLGDWRSAAKVLFESESLCGDITPSRQKREETSEYVADCVGTLLARDYKGIDSYDHTKMIARGVSAIDLKDVSKTLTASYGMGGADLDIKPLVLEPKAYNITFCDANGTRKDRPNGGLYVNETDVSNTLTQAGVGTNIVHGVAIPINTMTCQGRPSDNGRMGLGIGKDGDPCPTLTKAHSHAVAFGFEPSITKREGNPSRFSEEMSPTLRAQMGDNQVAVAIGVDTYNGTIQGDVTATMTAAGGSSTHSGPKVMQQMRVRRLTPMECERLQGFPDNYTRTPTSSDTTRYKALGNSMAVPVMKWIGERINKQERGEL